MTQASIATPALWQVLSHTLWDECDALYARDPMRYITLQDAHQLNVNLLLLAQWLDNTSIKGQTLLLDLATWSTLHDKVQAHDRHTLIPYRNKRRERKSGVSTSEYQHMLEKELLLERQTQQFILTEFDAILQDPNNIHISIISPENTQPAHYAHTSNTDTYLSVFNPI